MIVDYPEIKNKIFAFLKKNFSGPMSLNTQRRMCTFTNRPIDPKDRSSVQIPLAVLDEAGRCTGEVDIVDICGSVRTTGEVDSLLFEYSMKQ